MMEHSNLPFRVRCGRTSVIIKAANGHSIAWCSLLGKEDAQTNAAFIVTACNYHERLISILIAAKTVLFNGNSSDISKNAIREGVDKLLSEIEGVNNAKEK